MKTNCLLRNLFLGAALLGAISTASSMTIGGIRGSVIVGQPLNLTIPVTANPGEDGQALCLAAEVFHGEAAVDTNRVNVSMAPADAAGNALVRIRSAAVVDEAFVSVNLRLGCAQTLSRRFVLLSDVIVETQASLAATAAPAVISGTAAPAPSPAPAVVTPPQSTAAPSTAAAAAPTVVPAATAVPRSAAVSPGTAAVPQAPVRRTQAAATTRAEAKTTPKPPPKKAARASQPKLKLDPVQTVQGKDSGLRSSTELGSAPAATPEKSAEAAALWRSLNTQPEEVLKEAQRVQAMEAELKSLRDLTNKNQAMLAEMNARLQKAEEERQLGSYFYLLLALLVLTVAAFAVAWVRLRRRVNVSAAWWEDRDEVAKADMRLRMVSGGTEAPGKGAAAAPDVDLGDAAPGNRRASTPAKTQMPSVGSAATVSMAAAPVATDATMMGQPTKSDAPEELFDIRQQAEFFLSLGQTDQAIAALSNHIRSNEDTGPLAYLDLLRIYHSSGKTADYESLRGSVVRVFNVDIPAFAEFDSETRNLESYSELTEAVQAAWGTPKAVKMLEALIYRRPGSKWNQAFGLTAYRELLSLHALAREVAAMPAAERKVPSILGGLPTASWSASRSGADAAPSSGLDLDLGGIESPAVGDISAYLEKPEADQSMAATVPARLEDRPAAVQQAIARAAAAKTVEPEPKPEPEPMGNLLDFDVEPPTPKDEKPKS